MSLLSNLLAFSSLVTVSSFRILQVKNNKDRRLPTADSFLKMTQSKLLSQSKELYQKVYPKWDYSPTLAPRKLTQNIVPFIEFFIVLAWKLENSISLFLLRWKLWRKIILAFTKIKALWIHRNWKLELPKSNKHFQFDI